ncbi:hypothetical protein [uncultured Sphingomonas sp.]|uniref:hypothetical protein n=1 Tax=uncultured Sphingomonas sp. TaxID=158754 RepID=UPI0026184641|nr:hypothetical protein [uncultured Sphingomonas sp.]
MGISHHRLIRSHYVPLSREIRQGSDLQSEIDTAIALLAGLEQPRRLANILAKE